MSEQTLVAESSSAPVMEVDRGPLVNLTSDQRAEFRRTGDLPEPPKKEESATSDAGKAQTSEAPPEGEAKPAGETETPKKPQEQRRKPGAEHRIGELTSEVKRLKTELETLKKPAAEQSKPQPKPEPPQQQTTRQKPTAEDKKPDGTSKYLTYEDFVEELADWKAEQRWASAERDRTIKAQTAEFQSRVDEAKSRYGAKFDEVLSPTVNAIVSDQSVSPSVKAMLNDSEVLPDLIFTIGSDPKELATFLNLAKTSPGKALRYIALTESLIREELESGKESSKTEKPPAKPQTSAPKPPAEVGGRASTPGDTLESAAKANDFRSFKAEANRRHLARLKG